MRRIFGYVGLVSVLSVVACGGEPAPDFGPDPDFAAIETKLRSPTGTTSEETIGDVLAAVGTDAATADGKATIGLSSLVTLDASATLRDPTRTTMFRGCSDIEAKRTEGTCSCTFGGEIDYAIEKNGETGMMRVRLSSCELAAGLPAVDGTMHVFVARSEGSKPYEMATADWRMRGPDGPVRYAPLLLREGGITFYPIETADGYVVAGRLGGVVFIRDRDREITCTSLETGYRCTGSDGSELTVVR